jgi:PIN domain-containing protein
MIVVLDSTTLHSDVYAERALTQALLAAAGERYRVWVPTVVIAEIVRQLPGRVEEARRLIGDARHDLQALGLDVPVLPDEEEIARQRQRLLDNLDEDGVEVAPPPDNAGKIAEWVAERREPIPGDGAGTVDAQVWLTAVQAAVEADGEPVYLITDNISDFADPQDKKRLHPTLCADLEERGLDADAVIRLGHVVEFIKDHVEPDEEATGTARALLAHGQRSAELAKEIEAAIPWFPLDLEDEWARAFEAEMDEGNLVAFDVGSMHLIRADAGSRGAVATIEAYGDATLDLGLFKYEASGLEEGGDVDIEQFDWNESMSRASAVRPARFLVEVLIDKGGPAVSVEDVQPILDEDVCELLEQWAGKSSQEALELVAAEFDVGGEQEATHVWPRSVEKFELRGGAIFARVEFGVDYANPVDESDTELSAENVAETVIDLKIEDVDFEQDSVGEVSTAPNFFPN